MGIFSGAPTILKGRKIMEQVTAPAKPVTSILDMLQPFEPDDGQKGSFLVLRIAGIDRSMALRLINRKYRSWQNWRATDNDFQRLDAQIPELIHRFGGEARVMRTALLDIHIVEAGIGVFRNILENKKVTDGMWAYAAKLAGLRIPMMGAERESGSPWERLANSIQNTMNQKELSIRQDADGSKTVTAREITVLPSAEQRQVASGIVEQMLAKAETK